MVTWSSESVSSRWASGISRGRAAFYEALGWRTGAGPEDDVVFFQAGGMVVALWGREQLAEDSGVEDSGGWGGVTLAHNVRSPEEVDAVMREAEARRRDDHASRQARPSGAATPARSPTPMGTPGRSRTTRTGRSPRTGSLRRPTLDSI